MMRKKRVFAYLILFSCILIQLQSPVDVGANPIAFDNINIATGEIFALGNNVSMPIAGVHIDIQSYATFPPETQTPVYNYTILLNSTFQISSTINQNVTIAFVYPDEWSVREYYDHQVTYLDMRIRMDDASLSYSVFSGSELNITDFDRIIPEIEDLRFATINISLIEGITYNLEVDTTIHDSVTEHDAFNFNYFVGSAKGWQGQTTENIELAITKFTQYKDVTFFPNDSLHVADLNTIRVATWLLEFPSFQDDYVGCSIAPLTEEESEYPTPIYAIVVGAVIIVAAVVLFSIIKRRT